MTTKTKAMGKAEIAKQLSTLDFETLALLKTELIQCWNYVSVDVGPEGRVPRATVIDVVGDHFDFHCANPSGRGGAAVSARIRALGKWWSKADYATTQAVLESVFTNRWY